MIKGHVMKLDVDENSDQNGKVCAETTHRKIEDYIDPIV